MQWALIQDLPIKRLNIIEGAPVDIDYFNESLTYLVEGSYDQIMSCIYSPAEMTQIKWYWKHLDLEVPLRVMLYKTKVEHQLRFCNGTHREDWIFGLFESEDGVKRLAPLKRMSDFDDFCCLLSALLPEPTKIKVPIDWYEVL